MAPDEACRFIGQASGRGDIRGERGWLGRYFPSLRERPRIRMNREHVFAAPAERRNTAHEVFRGRRFAVRLLSRFQTFFYSLCPWPLSPPWLLRPFMRPPVTIISRERPLTDRRRQGQKGVRRKNGLGSRAGGRSLETSRKTTRGIAEAGPGNSGKYEERARKAHRPRSYGLRR